MTKRVEVTLGTSFGGNASLDIEALDEAGFRPGDRVVVMAAEDARRKPTSAEEEEYLDQRDSAAHSAGYDEGREAGRAEAAKAIAKQLRRLALLIALRSQEAVEAAASNIEESPDWRAYLPGAEPTKETAR